jgi:hypothetical protein
VANEDTLAQFPMVRDCLQAVATAVDRFARVERSPLGQIASKADVNKALDAMFSPNPLPGSAREVGVTMQALARVDKHAANALLRAHVESVFNEATQALQSGANQFGGAGFAAVLRGNRQQAENLEAAFKALPNGEKTWAGVSRYFDFLEASGQRQRIGTITSFNNEALTALKTGKPASEALSTIATAGTKLPATIKRAVEEWRLGRNVDQLAYLFTDPRAASAFQALATAPVGAEKALGLAFRITGLGVRGYNLPQATQSRPQERR